MRRRPFSSFSTEQAMQLLVDPMCNFFAGLVFLSVLVALLAKDQPASPWKEELPGRTFANEELLTARLAEVREETEELKRQNLRLAGEAVAGIALPSLSAVEKALVQAAAEDTLPGGLSSPEKRARLEGALIRERDRLRSRTENLGNEIAALKEESTRLQGRLARLTPAGSPAAQTPSVRVRLPVARTAGASPLYVLVSGKKFYPLQDGAGREDDTHVVREKTVATDEIKPREGKGLVDGEAMAKFLASLDSRKSYPVLVVYADSFDQYQALRQILEVRQLPYAWEPRPVGAPFRLSAQGFKPEVQ